MKTIEKGMYVRTEYGIAKVVKLSETMDSRVFYLDRDIMACNDENWKDCCTVHDIIGEPSFNIMDLIEKGDLVELTSEYCKDEIYRVIRTDAECIALDCFGDGFMCVGKNKDIKRILTKEQFTSGAYEVKTC